MVVPLRDQSGKIRYYLGAQVDITSLINECTGLSSLMKLLQRQKDHHNLVDMSDLPAETVQGDEFEELGRVFNPRELEKLVALRQRQQISDERAIYADASSIEEKETLHRTPLRDLDSGFQLNGEGSAPPLGYYKTVSPLY